MELWPMPELILKIIIFTILFVLLKVTFKKSYKLPPGPWGIPIIGHLALFLSSNPLEKLELYRKKYGPVFRVQYGRKEVVVLSDFASIKEMFKSEGLSQRASETLSISPEIRTLLGTNDKEWKFHRRFAVTALSELNREKVTEYTIQAEAARFLHLVGKLDPFSDIDVHKLVVKATNNMALSMVCGKKNLENNSATDLLTEYNIKINTLIQKKPVLVGLNIPQAFHGIVLPIMSEAVKAAKKMDDFLKEQIKYHEQDFDSNNLKDFIDLALLELQRPDCDRKVHNYEQIRTDAPILMMGISEAVGIVLSWIVLLLAEHSDLQERIFIEIQEMLGDRIPESSDAKQLAFTEAFILESMRYRTTLPMSLLKETGYDMKANGFDIKKGTWIMANFSRVHSDPNLWKDPLTFSPERFLSKTENKVQIPDHWVAFSYGSRNCLGKGFGRVAVFIMVTSLVQKFQILPSSKGVSLEGYLNTGFSPRYPYVRFQKRDS